MSRSILADRKCRALIGPGFVAAASCSITFAPQPVEAHGFGQRYDLPLPLDYFLWGGGLAVALTFAIAALLFARADSVRRWSLELRLPLSIRVALCAAAIAGQIATAFLFLLLIAAGIAGSSDPFRNIAPTLVWVLWWVGFAFVVALVGNVWQVINPLETLHRWASTLVSRRGRAPLLAYPAALDAWPAVVLFLLFAWAELVWPGADRPFDLALAVLAYSLLTWLGMTLFGRRQWLAGAEVFSIVFALFGRFAPVGTDRVDGEPRTVLRPWGEGLLVERPVSPAMIVLTVCLLATVSYDGFAETSAWQDLVAGIGDRDVVLDALITLDHLGWPPDLVIRTAGLIAAPIVFLAVFLIACRLMAACAGGAAGHPEAAPTTVALAGRFVFTLVPIAVAYHLSHYLSYLAIAGQYAIPLASDPFGFGWDLFGTRVYRIDVAILNARTVWHFSVAAIVIGHAIAIVLAHREALRVFRDPRRATRSQLPMAALMVAYTMISLWIIAQPIVND